MTTTTATRVRAHAGPFILGYGFRPFFLGAAIWAALAMLLWLAMLAGVLDLPIAMGTVDWHVHELLYGFVPAVVAGFLLTAVPNWTGRLPVTGAPLLVLVLLWLVGRLAVLLSAVLGETGTALIDLAFLAALVAVAAREVIAGRSLRNLPVVGLVGLLLLGNALFHLEVAAHGTADYGKRLGIAVILMLIMLIGGRIVPSFTRNWLAERGSGRLPVPFGRFDQLCLAVALMALAAWIAAPENVITAVLAAAAGLLHVARLARWAGDRTGAERLVLVLHLAYAFVPLGFLLLALALAAPTFLTASAAVHTWTTGAIGLMTLAVMTRASRGHSGRQLAADRGTEAIYLALITAASARTLAGTGLAQEHLQHLAGGLWIAAFAGFALAYAPMLTRASPATTTG